MSSKIRFKWTTEIAGGIAVFLAMSYVFVANPAILSQIPDQGEGANFVAGPDAGAVFVATCLLAGMMSIVIGWRAWSPSAIACGMGLNSLMVTFARDEHFNWNYLLLANFVVALVVLAMSLPQGEDHRSIRDKLLRDEKWLPKSLSSLVEASVAGMFAGIALDLLVRDQSAVLGANVEWRDLVDMNAPWSAELGLLPVGVFCISIVGLALARLILDLVADSLRSSAQSQTNTIARGALHSAEWALRLAQSVKIIAATIFIAVFFNAAYDWSTMPREPIEGLTLSFPQFGGPIRFKGEIVEALIYLLIYGATVGFVLLFDVSGSPHQMLSVDAPQSVQQQGPEAQARWADARETHVRKGFFWEGFGNLLAPWFAVSPVTCYGENNVVRDVGDEPGDGARTGIPAILVGLFFFGVLAFALARPDDARFWLGVIPSTAIAVMLAWVALIIGEQVVRKTSQTESPSAHGDDHPRVKSVELILAGGVSMIGSLFQGLGLGLCLGILAVFFVRLFAVFLGQILRQRYATIQPAHYGVVLLALMALLGLTTMIQNS